MKVSKTIASAVAAFAVVGAVGLASAQSGNTGSGAQTNNTPTAVGGEQSTPSGAVRGSTNTTNNSDTMMMAPSTTTGSGTMQAQPSTTTTMSGAPIERPAQADRN